MRWERCPIRCHRRIAGELKEMLSTKPTKPLFVRKHDSFFDGGECVWRWVEKCVYCRKLRDCVCAFNPMRVEELCVSLTE